MDNSPDIVMIAKWRRETGGPENRPLEKAHTVENVATNQSSSLKELSIGSDVEIAREVRRDLVEEFGTIVFDEGLFWRYARTHWEPIDDNALRLAVHTYDGALYHSPDDRLAQVKLSKNRINSVLNECSSMCTIQESFQNPAIGINCQNGFIRFNADGVPSLEPHSPDHRQRHTLPGQWHPGTDGTPPEGTLLERLLRGCFLGEDDASEKVALISEACGSAALGYATKLRQPRAIILFGASAENGKSQLLDLARGLLPETAVCSVTAAHVSDERHVVHLVGKLLNASDELSGATAIASDTLKAVVTGEPISGRDVYKTAINFRSVAQNIFATNTLPPFQGGLDRGVQRRLLVVPFSRTIPMNERIEHIVKRIAEEEPDFLLAWAVEGARRIIQQRNFTVPESCNVAAMEWIFSADPVRAWLSECTDTNQVLKGHPGIRTRDAYAHFRSWAVDEGFDERKLPAINGFVQRVRASTPEIQYKREADGPKFFGLRMFRGAI